VNTLKPEFFPKNMLVAMQKRKDEQLAKRNQYVEMSNEMFKILSSSNNLPTGKYGAVMIVIGTKGKALSLLN
jgi:hypothetical protein